MCLYRSPLKGDRALVLLLEVTALPTDAKTDATTAMAARLTLGNPRAAAKPSPSPQAATPKASESAMLSTVGAADTAADDALALTVATAASVLAAW